MESNEAHSIKEVLDALRIELKNQGFDASEMTDEELKAWIKEAGLDIIPNYLLN
jgi:arsenate reductase-like glutaredoxin family protein